MPACGWFPLDGDEIDGWVERHRHELPRTLEELSRLPIPFRKAVVRAVSADIRVSLWREHLSSFLVRQEPLSIQQRALLNETIAEMPAIVGDQGDAASDRARGLMKRLRETFKAEQAFAMFGTLGPPEPPEGLPIPADAIVHRSG
jgi:hypothetical protein